MKRASKLIASLLLALAAQAACADLVVVASPKSEIERLTQQEVIFLYMGRLRQLPSGIQAEPIDLAAESAERADFYHRLVNKEPAEIKAYWSRLVFSGGARPPRTAENREELIRLISSNPGAIGYLDRSRVDGRLRVVFDFAAPR